MTDTPNLGLPLLAAAQAQKHVTVNEALVTLDDLAQLAVLDHTRTAPPVSPQDGDRHIVAAPAAGDWAGQAGAVAVWRDGGWRFHAPVEGWVALVRDEARLVTWTGGAWTALTAGPLGAFEALGVGTAPDAGNPLSVRAENVLLSAPMTGAGDGDVRLKLNKAAPANVASLLFQSGWSGRAEFGLAGEDAFSLKVSADGGVWTQAMRIDGASGHVRFPAQGDALPFAHGRCRLIKDGASLRLIPYDGNGVVIGGVTRAVPAGGVTLAATGLGVNVTFYIYAAWSGAAMVLEASSTAPTRDPASGVHVKTGDASRTLVGMARTVSGPAWRDTAASRFVRSWFNRDAVHASGKLAASATTASGAALAAIDASVSLQALAWAGERLSIAAAGSAVASASSNARIAILVNSAAAAQSVAPVTTAAPWSPALASVSAVVADGMLTLSLAAASSAATLQWAASDSATSAHTRLDATIGA